MPAVTAPLHPLARTPAEWSERLASLGERGFRAQQVFRWLHARGVLDPAQMSDLPGTLRQKLTEDGLGPTAAVAELRRSLDGTRKLLVKMNDGATVESVLIPSVSGPGKPGEVLDADAAADDDTDEEGEGEGEGAPEGAVAKIRVTQCISTQVGCAMGCVFCASGLAGLKRDLNAGEIVAQLLQVCYREDARTPRARMELASFDNIVVMGMGEPLANYDQLIRALTILNADWGLGFGARRITISTSGLVPKILQLAEEPLGFRLAISLHGVTDEVREKIMPVNKAYPLAKLVPAIREFTAKHGRMVTLEFILIEDVNDALPQAEKLRDLARDLHAHVNLIPYNTVAGLPWKRPSLTRQERFADVLRAARVSVTLRREKGHDIDAACGQLRLRTEKERETTGAAISAA
jgi:23S rRNA (adenine2503-C2)-methyltransferase